ncbi:tRNA (N6-threonylcarbamoyladenosine(37)-N6)-methyltransferase TrmO [Aminobacter sp. HY435]|uniref:tRNA (N6-threonylcarbamoyladenosine(37)-N6)-methyltransferase TrmO n=1 Tax=Aminobacter sp. HY435 TaxID=2970917 RepID=UPI0022B98E30|nr:tRNA (N6-threonylcarbamoyladenosine(37)-N6)-methyltransferase TrmO [Aminobacter sp. HY435]
MFEQRKDEIGLAGDPAANADDARLAYIGRIGSPWKLREDCPKNMNAARERGGGATVAIDAPYRPGLAGLAGFSHVVVLSWFEQAPRNLIVQKPRHATDTKGVFALRSPARPNPVGLHVARIVSLDIDAGVIELDAIDALDGTPVIDLKPYFASVDAIPDATRPGKDA